MKEQEPAARNLYGAASVICLSFSFLSDDKLGNKFDDENEHEPQYE